MYKGRFDKSGGRSTADILRERAAQSPDHAAPQFPNPDLTRQAPDFPESVPDFHAAAENLGIPQAGGAVPPIPQQPPVRPVPPQAGTVPGPGGMPVRPGFNGQQPNQPPVPPQNPTMQGPGGMPIRPDFSGQRPSQLPVPPQNPTMQGPGGMPIRPGFNGQRPGQPPVPPQSATQQGPGGMPIRPGFNGQRPNQPPVPPQRPPVQGPGGMPIRPGYRPGPGPNAQAPKTPVRKPAAQKPAAPEVTGKKEVRKSSVVFYSCYFGFIFLFFVITFFGLNWLKGWLTDYEAAQPYTMADQIFKQNFENPNWKIIYQNSTLYATNPEDCDAYVALMEDKVGNSQLTYQETSAGLSGDKKYFIKLGDERIASFTLVGDSKYITDIPDWKLGDIELMVSYDNSYRIQMLEGHKAFVNDKHLDESHTIMKASTMAQEYLPVGTKGIRMWTQEIGGLMGIPTVRIQDEKGQEMKVEYDSETKTFVEQTEANTMTDAMREAAIGAAKVYGKYMIAQAGRGELAKFFDASSKIYSTIRDSEKIIQKSFFSSYDFGNPEILNFCVYSDDLFAARVAVDLNVTRTDGTIKPFPINVTLFFSQHSAGKWLAYDMTNEDVLSQPIGQVRITFNSTDGTQIASDFYETNATELDTPMITVPEGKVFSGWVREKVGEEGKKVLEVVFTPDETGHVVLTGNTTLEPMVLTPLFEDKTTEGGN